MNAKRKREDYREKMMQAKRLHMDTTFWRGRIRAAIIEDANARRYIPSTSRPIRLPWTKSLPMIYLPRCTPEPYPIDLYDHQLNAVNRLAAFDERGLLLYHHMGSGKTVTAMAAVYSLLRGGIVKNVKIFAPKTVGEHWVGHVRQFGLQTFMENGLIQIHTIESIVKPDVVKNIDSGTLLIVDEAHRYRTKVVEPHSPDYKGTQATMHFVDAATKAGKILLLTGTPIVNDAMDLWNLYRAIKGISWSDPVPSNVFDAIKPHVHYHKNLDDVRVPRINEIVEKVVMTPEYLQWYTNVEDSLVALRPKTVADARKMRAYINAIRQAVNGSFLEIASPKIEWLKTRLVEWTRAGQKTIVYSAWVDFGMTLISQMLKGLKEVNIASQVITGDTSVSERHQIVQAYNSGKMDVLLFTAAASEGMSLNGTSNVVIMEPHWNSMRTSQAMYRACRLDSHTHLPIEERVVNVYHLMLVRPDEQKARDDTADTYLRMKCEEKDMVVDAFEKFVVT